LNNPKEEDEKKIKNMKVIDSLHGEMSPLSGCTCIYVALQAAMERSYSR
jgi:hypothetical protein